MTSSTSSRSVRQLGATIGAGAYNGVRWLFDMIAVVLFVWWLKPLMRIPWLRPLVKQAANIMSGLRLLISIPLAFALYSAVIDGPGERIRDWLLITVGVALLDGVDGPVARRLDAVSDLGKGIDPVADKVFFTSIVIAFWYLITFSVNRWAGLVMIPVIIWVLNVERHLVSISLPTKRICDQLELEVPGANQWGKAKFCTQMVAIGGGWAFYTLGEHQRITAGVWFVAVLILARWLADKSLAQHRRELTEFQYEYSRRQNIRYIEHYRRHAG